MSKLSNSKEIEFHPDAWGQRFERVVDVVAKSPPQHRKAKPSRAKSPGGRTRRPQPKKTVK